METKGAVRRFGVMRRELGDLAGRLSRRRGRIPVDVARRDGGFVVRADLPGYDRRDLVVTAYRDGVRIVAGGERDRETGRGARAERTRPRLERMVDLPAEIDESSAVAEYHAGKLTIGADERRPRGERSIPVRTDVGAEGHEAETEERAAGHRPMGPTDEEVREYEARADEEFDRQRDFQRDKSGRQYRRT